MLSDVLGQSDVARKFLKARRQNRLAQAYILAGPDGIGKMPFAVELAKTFLCQEKGDDACEHCPSCRKVHHGNHEDIEVLEPTGAGKFITQESIHQLIERLNYKTRSGEHRYVILREADRMRPEAANHFLKTLEEPPTDVTFLLLTARMPALLETIVSRCQIVRMHRAAPDEIEQFLVKRGMEPDRARLYSRLADGCPGRAVRMEEEGIFDRRQRILRWLADLDKIGHVMLGNEVIEENRSRTLMEARGKYSVDLALMATIYRDMTLLAEGADPSLLYNPDVAGDLARRARKTGARRLREQSGRILESRQYIEANASPDLVISNLLADLAA
ncbi:MAG TPA: DNA polymerase III subunit delta' [Planctomycetota bacterium]|nr:DNA polymerase III subunit delta' [Planctomycetota bacterium]